MNILVTGGAGFIGSHLVEKLLDDDHEVVVMDDFNDFYDPSRKRANVAPYLGRDRFTLVEGDIRDTGLVKSVFREHRPERVVHLAARAGVRASLQEPLLYEEVNVQGTLILLEAAREAGCMPFVFGSSSSVYGVRSGGPFREDDRVEEPASPYAATKRACEHYCRLYNELYGIPVTSLRFFTVYGPRQRPEMAIHKFTRAIVSGELVTMFGSGKSQRDYTYIDDIIAGVIAAVDRTDGCEIINLGCTDTVMLRNLISTIERCVGKKAEISRLPDQPGDVPITLADVSKARSLLGYCPSVHIGEGVERFVRWYLESDS